MDALAAALAETGDTALDIVRGTGIPLPKVEAARALHGVARRARARRARDRPARLYAELPLSAVMDAEEGQ